MGCSRSLQSIRTIALNCVATTNCGLLSVTSQDTVKRTHTTTQKHRFLDARDPEHHEKEKKLTVRHGKDYFDEAAQKSRDKKTFQSAVSKYLEHQTAYRRGHVEFIYASLERMKEFGVNRDLDTYKQVFELFPKGGKLRARSAWEVEFMHYPKQQQCGIDILDQMEENGELH